MSRLKGRYVAQITIEVDEEYVQGAMLPVEKIKERWKNGTTPFIRNLIRHELNALSVATKVTVDQQYADINLVEVDNVDSDQ